MLALLRFVFVMTFVLCSRAADSIHDGVTAANETAGCGEPGPDACAIELECAECIPEHMPLVRARAAGEDGALRLRAGDLLELSCGSGRFLAYPLRAELRARCEAGRYRVHHDGALRHLLDLGCREDLFEDVLHPVESCEPPLQGRAYRSRAAGRARLVATACYDEERAVAVRLHAARAELADEPGAAGPAPPSLLGSFQHMVDASTQREAERLFADEVGLTRRLRELLKHERAALGAQTLTAGRLLAPRYLPPGAERAAEFASNKVAVWRSVAAGNLRHVQADAARLLRARPGARLWAGARGAAARPDGAALLLRGARFPVPRYVWTALLSADGSRGAALVLLNDPFVRVSEIRGAVFCESACAALPWLRDTLRHRNYERPLLGLVFCCNLNEFAALVPDMPRVFNSSVQLLV